jgi:hypothetical protein
MLCILVRSVLINEEENRVYLHCDFLQNLELNCVLSNALSLFHTQQHYVVLRRVRCVPCHHSIACPRVADGGTYSSYGG